MMRRVLRSATTPDRTFKTATKITLMMTTTTSAVQTVGFIVLFLLQWVVLPPGTRAPLLESVRHGRAKDKDQIEEGAGGGTCREARGFKRSRLCRWALGAWFISLKRRVIHPAPSAPPLWRRWIVSKLEKHRVTTPKKDATNLLSASGDPGGGASSSSVVADLLQALPQDRREVRLLDVARGPLFDAVLCEGEGRGGVWAGVGYEASLRYAWRSARDSKGTSGSPRHRWGVGRELGLSGPGGGMPGDGCVQRAHGAADSVPQ